MLEIIKKLAIISSHPIQYNAPLFALLAKEESLDLMVFYTWGEQSMGEKYDPDFQRTIQWDIPLLEGYNYRFLENTSKNAGSHHFKGIVNPTLNVEIENWGADIVWVWGWSFDSHLKAIRYFKGKKEVWFRGDSTLLDESKGFSLKKAARRLFLKWVYSHVDKAFYVGTHNKAYYIKHGLKDNQLVYAPHAVDNHRFEDSDGTLNVKAMEWRRSLGISDDQFVLLFAGKFEPKKNPLYLLKAWKELEFNKYNVVFVGNGSLEKELKSAASENCVFLPFQNQSMMPLVYKIADAFVLPSLSETWGLVINEALASGVPVIASNRCGGAIDLVDGHTGCIIDPIDENSIGKAIEIIQSTEFKESFDSHRAEKLKIHSYREIIAAVLNNI